MATQTIKSIIESLETWAPLAYQEAYDNCGLLTGNPSEDATGVLVSLDCTEAVVDEAIAQSCNLIIAHHPILFKGLKKLTGQNYVERVLIKAIRNEIAIYAMHTNLDNVQTGVNRKIAERLGLKNIRVLSPKKNVLTKLVTFIPKDHLEKVTTALHEAGAGQVGNYRNCSFSLEGEGRFMPTGDANPLVGNLNQLEKVEEVRVEVLVESHNQRKVLMALKLSHPYEEVAYYITPLENENQEVGAGVIGELENLEDSGAFLKGLKQKMNTDCVRHTSIIKDKIKKVAVCGGAGSFLLQAAIAQGADVFVSADFKYHEFFDADNRIIIADIGHYESEQFTKELIGAFLSEKFPTFAIAFSKVLTNPITYL